MTEKESKELFRRLNSIKESLDILVKLTALNIGKDTYFKNKERKDEKIEALATLEIPDRIVALIVGSSPESVQVLRSKMKRKTAKSTREIEFHAEDLLTALSNTTMFPSLYELRDFAQEILNPLPPLVYYESKDETVSQIIKAFQASDRRKQALFIQALEHRATARELKDTQFLKFLEGWEAHIKG